MYKKKPGTFKFTVFLFLFLLAVVMRVFVGEPCTVPSPSMEPAILTGDWLWINKITYGCRLPARWADIPLINIFTWIKPLREADRKNNWRYRRAPGFRQPLENDIVVFNSPENGEILLVKRISLIIRKGTSFTVCRENQETVENIIKNDSDETERFRTLIHFSRENDTVEYTLQQNFYYMLGDNAPDSRDSRVWGYVSEKAITGKINRVLFSTGDSQIRWKRFFLNTD